MSQTQPKYPNTPEQTQWLTRIQNGDEQAFSHIFEKYKQPIFNLCYYKLKNSDEANEAVQETFLRAYLKLNSYDPSRSFSTWLFSLASNYCTDVLRHRQVKSNAWNKLVLWQNSEFDEITPEELLIKAETNKEIHATLQMLPPENCVLLVLKYWYNASYDEIAYSLNTTISAIKSKLFRARQTMAQGSIQPHEKLQDRYWPPHSDCNLLLTRLNMSSE
jgi:RNA polymerase sigma-70 factor (ECF subfamily)